MRYFREFIHSTEIQVAQSLGIHPGLLYIYENNGSNVPEFLLPLFCRQQGAYIEWLESGIGEKGFPPGAMQQDVFCQHLETEIKKQKNEVIRYKKELAHIKCLANAQSETIAAQREQIDLMFEVQGMQKLPNRPAFT